MKKKKKAKFSFNKQGGFPAKCLVDRIPSWFYRGCSSATVLTLVTISWNCAMECRVWSLAGVTNHEVTGDLLGVSLAIAPRLGVVQTDSAHVCV